MKDFIAALLLCLHMSEAFQSIQFRTQQLPSTSCRTHPTRNPSLHVAAEQRFDIDTDFFADDEPSTPEYALLLPGHTVKIQIGDVTASRKAWKKRRRNSSPILIPCSILGMSREWMVRWNVMALLYMIGEESSLAGGAVGATAGKLNRAYRERLDGDLKHHATALGYETVESLLQALFDERIQAEYGVRSFVEPQHGNLMLATSLTRRQARTVARSAGVIQFRAADDQEVRPDNMIHTGMAQLRRYSAYSKRAKTIQESLGAAIRVRPDDEALERYKQGDEFNAFVHSYDLGGDNESPLLVLTVNDPRGNSVAGTFGSSTRVSRRRNMNTFYDASIERKLGDLTVGDGPIQATVVAVSPHSNSVFVDCGVGRTRGKRHGGGMAKVLGMLRFEDMQADEQDVSAGDTIEVYVKAVFNQSGRFMVSTDPSVKSNKPKDMKQEKEADKRIERLSSKFNTADIDALIGKDCDGVVKAKSKTGNWYYVKPNLQNEDGVSLPVGVASFLDGEESSAEYSPGDAVRVRLEGIDEKRGQLSMTLLE